MNQYSRRHFVGRSLSGLASAIAFGMAAMADTVRLQVIGDLIWECYLFSRSDSAFYLASLQYELASRTGDKSWMGFARE